MAVRLLKGPWSLEVRPDRGGRITSLRLHGDELLDQGIGVDEPEAEDFSTRERLPERPLRDYTEDELRLTREQFDEVMAEMA